MYFIKIDIVIISVFTFTFFDFFNISESLSLCPKLKLQNGRVRYRQRGRFVKFMCNTGFMLAGDKYSTCEGGKWDSPPPRCVRNTCLPIKKFNNGFWHPSHFGAVVYFFCKSGYKRSGPEVIYCDGAKWDKGLPNCFPSNDTQPKLSCDFETDFCGWTHDLNHHFDWTRQNGYTPTGPIGTGPSFDHTKGEAHLGYYAYIESSSKNENDTGRLISPIYEKSSDNICFNFYYHMYGSTTGTLNVFLKKVNETWNFNQTAAFFSKSGNQGDIWFHSVNELGPIDQDFQIIIEGIRGPGYFSDIAIDDLSLVYNCSIDEFIATSTTINPDENEPVLRIDSCQNRCGLNDTNVAINNSKVLLKICDCDDSCWDRGHCCPDYVYYCFLDITQDFSTTESEISSTLEEITTNTDASNESQLPEITEFQNRTEINVIPLTTQATTFEIDEKPLTSTTELPNEIQEIPIETTRIHIMKKPPIITETTPIISTTTNLKTTLVFKKEEEDINEDIEDKENSFSSENPDDELKKYQLVYPKKKLHKIPETNIETEKTNFVKILIIVFSSVIIICSIILVTFFIKRRYTKQRFGSGDSQSDVRFLANDETLNFELDDDSNGF